MINHEGAYYGDHVYEPWVDGMGWLMVALAIVWIPIMALVEYCGAHGFLEVNADFRAIVSFCYKGSRKFRPFPKRGHSQKILPFPLKCRRGPGLPYTPSSFRPVN